MENLLTAADLNEIKKAALIFRALNHKLRQQMIDLILQNNNKLTVTELYVQMRLEQSVASQHLAILRQAGIVKTERNGKFIFYSVNNDRLNQIKDVAKELNEHGKQ